MNVKPVNMNTPKIYVDSKVSKSFADNTLRQYNSLLRNSSSDIRGKSLVILKNAQNAQNIKGIDPNTLKYFEGDGSIAYGLYAKNSDTIFIMEDNHERKVEKYEGKIDTQGADTLTHEFGHLLDKGVSSSNAFKKAYLSDLKNLYSMLQSNPEAEIDGSDMTYADSVEYFKHYMEGVDFTDGIDEEDITRTGLRENFAESFSNIFDSNKTKVNEIYSTIFANSTEAVKNLFIA